MDVNDFARATVAPRLPRIGEPAPQFEASTTHGTLRLEDFKGSWLVLFSHPADFTPVCTTEFVGFAKAQPALRELDTELMGLSIDSVYSHISWVRNDLLPADDGSKHRRDHSADQGATDGR